MIHLFGIIVFSVLKTNRFTFYEITSNFFFFFECRDVLAFNINIDENVCRLICAIFISAFAQSIERLTIRVSYQQASENDLFLN